MLTELNPEQLQAVEHTEGPLLVLAGAGTGKTRVLTQRIAHIVSNGLAYPSQIMAVTFTNKAANEMLTRTEQICSQSGFWIGTFHSLATKIIRNHTEILGLEKNFTIIDVDDQWRLLKKIVKEMNLDEKIFAPKIVAGFIGRWKDLGLFPEELTSSDLSNQDQRRIKIIFEEYQKRMKLLNALDFGDLLLYCLKLFKQSPEILMIYQEKFRYIMVDEYQDTNASQYLWLRYLSQKHKNICAVGDEDQSIYGWRGAEIRNIMKFSHDFSGSIIIRLEQNYRSRKHILSTANQLIRNNTTRIGKNLWTECVSEEKVKIASHDNGYKEAEFIAKTIKQLLGKYNPSQMAILVRAGFQTRIIEDVFIQNQIGYKIIAGLKFYDRLEIKNSIAYIRLAFNSSDSLAFERIINVPKRGIGIATLNQIQDFANLKQISYFEATKNLLAENNFKGKLFNTLNDFINRVLQWKGLWNQMPSSLACQNILEESGYLDELRLENSLESESRLDNIKELIRNIGEFDSIELFLEHISLVNEVESSGIDNTVKIMTMHAAKGLEFSVVFLPGWEEDVFPSKRSIEEKPDGIEEERRLAYVAITRAKEKLYISHSDSRMIYGQWQHNSPSIFLKEIESHSSIENISSYKQSRFENTITIREKTSEDGSLKIGVTVNHNKFGQGYVTAIDGNHISVNFSAYGSKKMLKDFLQLV